MELYLFFILITGVMYTLYGAFWRLYLSPIAHIPGPKLAALTLLYEAYYDLYLGGQYTFKIWELHKQYGPIIRISPWEVHVNDPDYYDTIYASSASGRKPMKYAWLTKFLGLDLCVFSTVEHDLHRKRRAPLLPYFSKSSVTKFQPVIQERVDVLLRRLLEYRTSGETLNASDMYSALSNDVVNQFSFARCDHLLETPAFDPSAREASLSGATSGALMKHVPWLNDVVASLPDALASKIHPALATFINQKRQSEAQIARIVAGEKTELQGKKYTTIFHSILDSNLPPEEKTMGRLSDDAQMMVMAGTLTTATTLHVIHFWLLSQPETLKKLKAELCSAIPSVEDVGKISLATIEALPYLTGVIKEGLRLSYGVASRLQRIDPDNDLVYTDKGTDTDWIIPRGTPVGETSVMIHHNEDIFPDSKVFRPERWLENKGQSLERYLVSFSKGTRICLGINVAYAELYLAVAAVWRLWGSAGADGVRGVDDLGVMSLWRTNVCDVEIESDQFVPRAKRDSKGIQITVET